MVDLNILIIGSGTGALFTAMTIKKRDRKSSIIIVDRKDFDILHSCGLPYVVEGKVSSFEKLKSAFPDIVTAKYPRHEAISISPNEKFVKVKNLETGNEFSISYDSLVISTGSSSFIPPVPGAKELLGRGVFKMDSLNDAQSLSEFIKDKKRAAVIGAGAIGLETAHALNKRGLDVTIIEAKEYVLPNSIDKDIAQSLMDYLNETGIKTFFESRLDAIKGNDKVEQITVNGEAMDMDVVIMATGVRPNTGFLGSSGIELGKFGIIVNNRMQTSQKDIYAVGDCVQVKSLIDNKDCMMQLAVAAYKQGIVAGYNILGIDKTYKGALNTFSSRIGSIEIASTGFNSNNRSEEIVTGKASGLTKPEWYNKETELTVKIIADRQSGRLLGGQAIGTSGAANRIDIISAAIKAGFSVYDLSEIEMAYCPATSETYDVLMQAADNAIRKLEGKK